MKSTLTSLLLLVVFIFTITGCISIPKAQKEVVFTEVSFTQCDDNYSFRLTASNGYSGIFAKNVSIRSENGIIIVGDSLKVESAIYISNNPDLNDRIEKDKKYAIYLRIESQGNFISGFTYTPILERIDGLRPLAEIVAEKEELQRIEAERKAAEHRAEAEKIARRDQQGRTLATGYIYHGINEESSNARLFNSGALEEGHAYYISAYMVYGNGSMGGAITSMFVDPDYHYVDYISQKVKGEVVGAGQTMFGPLPVRVIVAGGKEPFRRPVILGLVD